MDPARKRTIRFVVALTAAMLLSGALVYTSFGASTETVEPSQLLARADGDRVYELTGKVEKGSWRNGGDTHSFRVEDRAGGSSVPVTYAGPVPDPFREGREVIIDVRRQGDTFVGEHNSLITKCPSKFTAEEQQHQG
jgi:cytochrome c-type biogenesis protein CcmE